MVTIYGSPQTQTFLAQLQQFPGMAGQTRAAPANPNTAPGLKEMLSQLNPASTEYKDTMSRYLDLAVGQMPPSGGGKGRKHRREAMASARAAEERRVTDEIQGSKINRLESRVQTLEWLVGQLLGQPSPAESVGWGQQLLGTASSCSRLDLMSFLAGYSQGAGDAYNTLIAGGRL